MKYCTYITSHPSGFFYIGKAQVPRIEKGYTGSGIRLRCAYLWPGFSKDTWTTKVLSTFETEQEAFDHEAELVPREVLNNPYCLNDTPGGRRGWGSGRARNLKAARKKGK